VSAGYDVLVAGGGPAGATLALRMARRGFAVALVDRARFPRFKPCGEYASPLCAPLLQELGLGAALRVGGARAIGGLWLCGHGARALGRYQRFESLSPRRALRAAHGHGVRREAFDAVLLEGARAAGVEVFEGQRATALLRRADGGVAGLRLASGEGPARELRARWTIGADGLNSLVAREQGVHERIPWLDKLALVTRYTVDSVSDGAEVHVFDGGFFAACPVDARTLTVNLVVDRTRGRRRDVGAAELFESCLPLAPSLQQALARATRVEPLRGLGPLACRTRAQVFDGAALVGDACGYVDPITGEGIYLALRGAALLEPVLASALHERASGAAALADYARARRREFAPRFALALALQRGLRSVRLARLVLGRLERHPELADLLLALTGGGVGPADLLRPAFWAQWNRLPGPA
jgi:menaquinone-9 beta-reductase